MEQSRKQKLGYVCRRTLPYLPIIGIPLTIVYHLGYGDTGIEDEHISMLSAMIQAVYIFIPFLWLIL